MTLGGNMIEKYAVLAQDLRKSYGKIEAVKGISFQVPADTC